MDSSPVPHEDEALVRRFVAGESDACRRVEQWARDIARYRGYGMRAADQEDLVQDVLAAAWRVCSRPDFEVRRSLRAMVHKIALARSIDLLRRRRPTEELDEGLADSLPEPPEQLARAEQWGQVQSALQRLGQGCRELVRLRFFLELPYAEIAERTGRNEATLRVRLFQCMKEVRELLRPARRGLDASARR